jgi:hypothetical protein
MAIKKYEKSEDEKNQLGQKDAGRFDEGKVRHDLIPAWAIEKIAEVYTYGAQKYDDNNWWKGMKWWKVSGPLERHYNKWKRGRIQDEESNCYHLAMVAWNAIALMCYQKNKLGIDTRCPYNLDLLDEEERQKKIKLWLKCMLEGKADDYNGLDTE